MRKSALAILLILTVFYSAKGQQNTKTEALNNYVRFANESTHGMLVIHRLLEIFNQELNSYVDLPNHKMNNIPNKDLPENIFVDTDHWFYEISPDELFQIIKKEKNIIGQKNYDLLFPIALKIHNLCNKINTKRFQIADLVSDTDLNKRENQNKVYELLEEQVDNYDLYFAYIQELQNNLKKTDNGNDWGDVKYLIDIYNSAMPILTKLRYQELTDTEEYRTRLKNAMSELSKSNDKVIGKYKNDLSRNINNIIKIAKKFSETDDIEQGYKLYGKYYYYYNIVVLDKFNRYGNGFIQIINKILSEKEVNATHLLEYPHFYKVIYPEKIPEIAKLIIAPPKIIETLPKEVNNRTVNPVGDNVISVDTNIIFIELFDYKIQDGDIVSINYNGKWIYKNISLETKPKKLRLKINKKGKNYILLHAENVGKRPPNTIGVKTGGKTFILQSDMKKTDVIEINFTGK